MLGCHTSATPLRHRWSRGPPLERMKSIDATPNLEMTPSSLSRATLHSLCSGGEHGLPLEQLRHDMLGITDLHGRPSAPPSFPVHDLLLTRLTPKHPRDSIRSLSSLHDIASPGWPTVPQRSGALSASVATNNVSQRRNPHRCISPG